MLIKNNLRTICQSYVNDASNLFLFDADHAIIAYPIRIIKDLLYELKKLNIKFIQSEDENSFIIKICADKKGTFANFFNFT